MSAPQFDIQEELKKLPHLPGVYIMRDADETILYVGKAIDLHNRVRSYFRKITGRGIQIDRMVEQIARFEYIVTDSELEALVLENNLIKENRPRYNTLLKDDKTYPYIKVTVSEAYPRIVFSRLLKKDKSRYFGPFTSATAVRDTIELINKLYGLRTCNRVLPRDCGKERPCLNYHMKTCMGPCTGNVSQEEYRARIDKALDFLNGNYADVLKDLKQKMETASEEMNFEAAASYRDLISAVEQVSQKQKMTDVNLDDRDIIAIAVEGVSGEVLTDAQGVSTGTDTGRDAVVQVFFVRDGRLIGREHFYVKVRSTESSEDKVAADVLNNFVKQFYAGTPFLPHEILLPCRIEDAEVIERWLTERRGNRVYLSVPERGQKNKLMQLAAENAALILTKDRERLKREEGRTIGAVREIAQLLNMKHLNRMEAYDISNISGFLNVGSMVVYEQGRPKKSDYRKFRIQSVTGPDDYACMKEVLTRRLLHGLEERQELNRKDLDARYGSFTKFPDLILMDGGKGQVNIALQVLEELDVQIPVCGMVKDDHHNTRGLYYNNEEIPIDRDSEGFKLITRIQDEAHRFAIEYHRSLRSKSQVKSTLDDIPGIGPARRKALMRDFKSIEDIRTADVETLMQTPEIPEHIARQIFEYFHR